MTTRLQININAETAEALRLVVERRGISYTEAIRRAVAIYARIEQADIDGHEVRIVDGSHVQQVVLL